jgi:hypothetical protein
VCAERRPATARRRAAQHAFALCTAQLMPFVLRTAQLGTCGSARRVEAHIHGVFVAGVGAWFLSVRLGMETMTMSARTSGATDATSSRAPSACATYRADSPSAVCQHRDSTTLALRVPRAS